MGYHGFGLKISSDGLTVLDGDPAVNALSGDASVFVRASTALVGGMKQSQFELRVRHVWTGSSGEALAVGPGINADGTQIGLGGQQAKDSTGHKKRGEEGTEARGRNANATLLIVSHAVAFVWCVLPAVVSSLWRQQNRRGVRRLLARHM